MPTWPRKPAHHFVAGVARQPSSNLRLAHGALYAAYSTPVEGKSGRGCKAYALEDTTCIHHRDRRSGTVVAERVLGDGKSYPTPSDQETCAPQHRRALSPRRDRPEAGEAGSSAGGHDREARDHSGLAPQTSGPEVRWLPATEGSGAAEDRSGAGGT